MQLLISSENGRLVAYIVVQDTWIEANSSLIMLIDKHCSISQYMRVVIVPKSVSVIREVSFLLPADALDKWLTLLVCVIHTFGYTGNLSVMPLQLAVY